MWVVTRQHLANLDENICDERLKRNRVYAAISKLDKCYRKEECDAFNCKSLSQNVSKIAKKYAPSQKIVDAGKIKIK